MAEPIPTSGAPVEKQADHTTLTPEDIANGNLNINVGAAPLEPAEFVVVQIQQLGEQPATPSPQNPGKPPFAAIKRKP